ncbi:MAG: hypothetical protein K2I71_07410, partial [Helicobacter sp.]|nr:hypothetical protein [Helicobacter sp.]
MHFFIYPQGNCGKSIAWIFRYLSSKGSFNHTYSFIDDLTPLQDKQKDSKDECMVLIASSRNKKILIDKLRKRGV